MVAAIVAPTWATLATVRGQAGITSANPDPTPYGYTVSLGIFLIPVILIAVWHARHPEHPFSRRALLVSAAMIAIAGAILDFAFGYHFFTFENVGATLDVRAPAWSFSELRMVPRYLPVEEFLFYIFGGLFIATLYSWADCDWLRDYAPGQFAAQAKEQPKLLEPNGRAFIGWFGIVVVCVAIRSIHAGAMSVPWYFVYLMSLGFLPTVLFVNGLRDFVNWRAFAFAYSALLLVSLIWEVTLGVPYSWWGYKPEYMLGIRISAWSQLPIEAVLVWLVVAWDSVLAFEFARVFLHMDRPLRRAVFGPPKHDGLHPSATLPPR